MSRYAYTFQEALTLMSLGISMTTPGAGEHGVTKVEDLENTKYCMIYFDDIGNRYHAVRNRAILENSRWAKYEEL